MASKMISIREDVYEHLKRLKSEDESFSDVIEKLITGRQKDPLRHFGIAKDLPDEINDEFENSIVGARKKRIARAEERHSELWDEAQ